MAARISRFALVARYRALYACARRLTGGDGDLAGDLLQDAYIQFVVTEPDLERIDHLDAYLAAMVRNLHLSRLRRLANRQDTHVPIEEYDNAACALEHARPEDRIEASDALRRVCEYARSRKSSFKGASVLILRFFHDFYRVEIQRMMAAPAHTVSSLLSRARAVTTHPAAGSRTRAT
jgi:RNA polymerase sigma factor (sigma-70 family)